MIKASYTADRQYYAQASRALYRRKNTAFAIFGLAGLLDRLSDGLPFLAVCALNGRYTKKLSPRV
ncbi:MAG: hypothetical protein ACI3VA_12015 [Candidatus Limivicinus sp.]